MNTHLAYVTVIPPQLPLPKKRVSSLSNETKALLRVSSLLQTILSGIWQINQFGSALKEKFTLHESIHYEFLEIDLRTSRPLDLCQLLPHLQLVEENSLDTNFSEPVIILSVRGNLETSPTQLEIGARRLPGGKVETTYAFK
jgi:hypothetical protein